MSSSIIRPLNFIRRSHQYKREMCVNITVDRTFHYTLQRSHDAVIFLCAFQAPSNHSARHFNAAVPNFMRFIIEIVNRYKLEMRASLLKIVCGGGEEEERWTANQRKVNRFDKQLYSAFVIRGDRCL